MYGLGRIPPMNHTGHGMQRIFDDFFGDFKVTGIIDMDGFIDVQRCDREPYQQQYQ